MANQFEVLPTTHRRTNTHGTRIWYFGFGSGRKRLDILRQAPCHVLDLVDLFDEGFLRTPSRNRPQECLDFLIPLNERHLRKILEEWVVHNKGRPHSCLAPGIPQPRASGKVKRLSGRWVPSDHRVLAKPILGGLHREYRLERVAV